LNVPATSPSCFVETVGRVSFFLSERASPTHDQRIDLVFYRNFELNRRSLAWSWLVNNKRRDLRRYGTWSSDHAGIFSWLVFPKRRMVADG